MNVKCVAIIGKENNLVFLKNLAPQETPDLRWHYIVHASLDLVEEKMAKDREPFTGLLYSVENLAVYGYITATMLKFVMVVQVEQTIVRDMDVNALFHRLHKAYIGLISNPLREPNVGKMIRSGTFEHAVETLSLAARTH